MLYKHLRFFITLIFFFSIFAHSANSSWQAPLADKSLLLDITITPANRLVALGERGHILYSEDGKKWQQAQVPVQSTLTAVYFSDEQHGWAVGHDSVILFSKDGGKTWQVQQYLPELEKPLLSVVFKDNKQGIAVGAYGQFFRTEDGGLTWRDEFHTEFLLPEDVEYLNELKLDDEAAYLDEKSSILPHFNRIVADGRTLYLVGEVGLIAKSNDFGMTWQIFDEIYQGSFFDLARTQAGNLLLVGLRGHIFRSLNNGTPWQSIDSETTALLNDIVIADESTLFVLGNSGVLLKSSDDGKTFIKHQQPDGKALIAGVWFNGQLIVVSDIGIKTLNITN